MAKVSLKSQIGAVDAIVNGQFSIVASSQATRGLLIDQLRAVSDTLRWVAQHEAEIRAAIQTRKGQ
ncbi:hypothetical protein SAMN05880590_102776 [Rhizobium sp. RU35A]|uniref:hypothetical protein n=1 Tax=Rhizobium sp. RU35A TaxID=1907414 RepID=UPI000953AF4D|nr:hypothetical protein [Rhizobium sp. RU35A]SIQ24636.1 hypothetical protein SAMN05880590_102776 [Rhizobium sp. RU35A]